MKYVALVLLIASVASAQQPVMKPVPSSQSPLITLEGTADFAPSLPLSSDTATQLTISDHAGQKMFSIAMDRNAKALLRHYDASGTLDWIVTRYGEFVPFKSDVTISVDSRKFWEALAVAFQSSFTMACGKDGTNDKGRRP